MPKITDYGDYDVFKTPGLYTIINERSATVLDLYQSKAAAGTAIIGFKNGCGDNQKWHIADVGDRKYIITCRKTGSYVHAKKHGEAVKSGVGYPDRSEAHWRICQPDAKHPQIIEFHSVSLQGDVLELKDGSACDETEVRAYAQTSGREGQKWLVKKIG